MTAAVLFPGQGTDLVGLPAEWRRHSAHARHLLDVAAECTRVPIDRLLAAPSLNRTAMLQPVLTAVCTGIFLELRDGGFFPSLAAGHSLGELAACVAAGCMDAADAVAVAAIRGRLMDREALRHPGGMLAVATDDVGLVERAVAAAAPHGIIAIAAHNARDEWVVSGEWAALRIVSGLLRGTPLAVAGPWHCPALADATAEYREALCVTVMGSPTIELVCNRQGLAVTDAETLVDALAGQLTHPIEWVRTMRTLATSGCSEIRICGPGRTLGRLVRAALPTTRLVITARPCELPEPRRELAQ